MCRLYADYNEDPTIQPSMLIQCWLIHNLPGKWAAYDIITYNYDGKNWIYTGTSPYPVPTNEQDMKSTIANYEVSPKTEK